MNTSKFSNFIFYFLIFIGVIFSLPLFIHGSALFGDSNAYYALFNTINNGNFPYTNLYMPGMPLFMFLISKISGITNFRLYNIANIILMILNVFYLIKIQSFFISKLAKLFIAVFLFTNYTLQIQYMAHADALAFNFLLFLVLSLLKIQFNKTIHFFYLSILVAILIIIKYNYLVLVPLFVIWIFLQYPFKTSIKYSFFFLITPIGFFIFWKLINQKLNNFLGDNAGYGFFVEAMKINFLDMGKFFAQHYLTKIFYRFQFISYPILGLFAYVVMLFLSSFIFFKNKKFKYARLFYFLVLFVVMYPVAQMYILGKGGYIESNVRTLFPLFLISPLLIALILENTNQFLIFKYLLAFYLTFVFYLSCSFLLGTLKKPYYTSVNHVLEIKENYRSQFQMIKNKCASSVFYTDEENDARFFISCNLTLMPNSIRLNRVGKRDYALNYKPSDSLDIISKIKHQDLFFLYHRNNTKDTLFKPIILSKGATKIIDEPGCEIYYLAK
jgi:hypothetical protein